MDTLPDDIFPALFARVVFYTPVKEHGQVMCSLALVSRRFNTLLSDLSLACRLFAVMCGHEPAFALTCMLRFPRWVRRNDVVTVLARRANDWTHDFVTGWFLHMAKTSNDHTRALSHLLTIGLQRSEAYVLPSSKGAPLWLDRQFDPSVPLVPYQVVLAYNSSWSVRSPRPFPVSCTWGLHDREFWNIYSERMEWWDAVPLIEDALAKKGFCPNLALFSPDTQSEIKSHIQRLFVRNRELAVATFLNYPDAALDVLSDASPAVQKALADFALSDSEPEHLMNLLNRGELH